MRAHRHAAIEPTAEADRHAYNAAFEELGLAWHWDPATFAGLQGSGANAVRHYLQAEHAHLLRAYEADFLVQAIETAKARCHPQLAHRLARSAPWSGAAVGGSPDRLAA